MTSIERQLVAFTWIVFGIFLAYRIMVVFYPQPDAGGVEGNVIYFIQRILDGQPLYTDPSLPPYAIAQYSPLYYYLVAGAAKLFSISADNVPAVFMVSRSVALMLTLGWAWMVFLVTKNIFKARQSASVVAALCAFVFLEITSFSRPDSLYHLLFLSTLYIFLRMLRGEAPANHRIEMAWFSLLATLTILSKQTGALLPVLAAGWFLWTRQVNRFFFLTVTFVSSLATGLLLVHYAWGIDVFYKNVVLGVANGIWPGWFYSVVMPSYHLSFGLLFILASLALLSITRGRQGAIERFSAFFLVIVFLLMNVAALKYGSGAGYFTEWTTFVLMGCAAWLPGHPPLTGRVTSRIGFGVFAGAMVLKTVMLAGPIHAMLATSPASKRRMAFEQQQAVAERVLQATGNDHTYSVFLNLYTPDSYLPCLLFREAILPQMDIVSLASYPQKRYDYTDLRRRLTDGSIRYMILKERKFEKRFYDISLEHFRLVDSLHGYLLYESKPMNGDNQAR